MACSKQIKKYVLYMEEQLQSILSNKRSPKLYNKNEYLKSYIIISKTNLALVFNKLSQTY